ncbi:alkaline phosphatase-like protein [Cylindrospermum sp. NIES-4074]|nr:alkaline phosphatase-like protein [Cylindrospermum sp. NIES-4074]
MALAAGNIAFVGFNADGNDDFAFVAIVDINIGETITFEDNEWDGSAFNTGEGRFTWTATSLVTAGTIVRISSTSLTSKSASIGTLSTGTIALGNSDESIYAYQGSAAAPTFITAISSNAFSNAATGTLTNTGLTAGVNALALSGSIDVAAYNGSRSGQANFASYLSLINDPANWQTQDGTGDQSIDGTAPDVPFSSTAFSINAAATPTVNLSVSTNSGSEAGTTQIIVTAAASSAVSGNQTVNLGVSGTGITASDYYLSKTTITIPDAQTSGSVTFIVADDAVVEATETATLTISTPSAGISLGNTTQNITITNNDSSFLKKVSGITSTNGAEIPAFDPVSKQLFVVAGSTVEFYSLSNTGSLTAAGSLTPGITPPAGTELIPNSVAVKNGVVAVAYAIKDSITNAQQTGKVAFFNAANGSFISAVDVGALPDMLTFTPDGTKILVANEGEPNSYGQANSVDPEGSVSIINIAGGVASATVQTATFTSFNSQIASLKAAGVRITAPGATVAQDLEPEYIAVDPDGLTARITLEENNAIAILDIASATITQIIPLGAKNFNLPGNGIDASDQDGGINIRNVPVFGLYQPDAIANFTVNGQTYYITANEGDSRNYPGFNEEIRVGNASYVLDPTVFPNATILKQNANLGRLQLTNATGDTDGDGDIDRIEAFGARSFSIWDASGNQVFDSGDQIEQITATKVPTLFNSEGTAASFDSRSDNKGPEPEGVAVGVINNRTYAFIGLERTGDVIVYDVTNPNQPQFVQYINTPEDVAPEGLTFISAADSPTDKPLLVTANEVSKTVAVFEIKASTYISDVQGSGATSPLSGQTVTIEGVVTADFQLDNQLRGFFIQEEDADRDGNSATSEGIFVFTGNNPPLDVQEGQIVRVTGSVSEFFNMTQITATSADSIAIVNAGNNLSLVTPTIIDLPATGDINSFYEQQEGMLVKFADKMYVSEYFELARYGQIVLTADGRPYQYSHTDNTPTATEYTAFLDDLNRKRIILDDDNDTQNSPLPNGTFYYPQPGGFGTGTQGTNYFRGGDTISNLTGVLHWSFAGQSGTDAWRIRPTQANPITFTAENPRPANPPDVGGNVKVASFNVLSYFSTIDVGGNDSPRGADSADEFDRQNTKLIDALEKINADVFGLIEIENNNTAVQELVNRLNTKVGAGTYDYINTGIVGTDEITVAVIYKPSVVQPKGSAAILTDSAFTNPNNTSEQRNRPAIAQTFQVINANNPDFGESFNVVVNHLKSKGGSDATGADVDQNDGQGQFNDTRTKAANYLVNTWIPSDPTDQGDPDFLIIGDLNAYKGETPITTIKNAGYTNLVEAYGGNNAYSYVFDGQLGYLDHALANTSLASQVTGIANWHINADEVPVFDYNNTIDDGAGEASFEAKPTGNNLYEPNAFRTSDHDPVIIGLNLNGVSSGGTITISGGTITILVNNAPTDLTLSATSVNENVPANTVIGTLTTIVPDQGDTFTYTLVDETPVDGVDGRDNSAFTISGNSLIIRQSPDFEVKSTYNIGVRTTDKNGLSYTKGFVVKINDIPTQILNSKDDVFNVLGEFSKVKLKVKLTGRNSSLANELGVFTVDDQNGTINGIAPGAAGYTEAALARSKVIFSAIANNPNGFNPNNLNRLLEFDSNQYLRFYLVKNSTIDAVKAKITSTSEVLFSNSSIQTVTALSGGGFALGWKDGSNNTSSAFNDLVVDIVATNDTSPIGTGLQGATQAEVIDLRSVNTSVSAQFTVNREAAFNNFVGFYQVADENGGIDTNGDRIADILVGQAGYTQAAVRGRVAGIELTVNNQGTATYTGTFSPGAIFAPFMIVNGRPDAILDTNLNNDPAVYFPYLGANADKVDHIRLLGDNTFGFEDLVNGGDQDFNDAIVRVNLSIA